MKEQLTGKKKSILACGHPATPRNIRWVPHRTGRWRKCRRCLVHRKMAARQYVHDLRKSTVCETCGEQPIDWHRREHEQRPHQRISAMAAAGRPIAAIADEIAKCTALCRRCHMTLDGRIHIAVNNVRNSPRPKGQAHPRARLTDAQIDDIKRQYASGMTQEQLGAMFGVHRGWVSLIVRGKRREC